MKTHFNLSARLALGAALLVVVPTFVACSAAQSKTQKLPQDVVRMPVVFSGGHETLEEDHGRPVILIAAALGVPPQVFREAFSRVHPAAPGSGGPTGDEARANKAALLGALAKYGVTNERLDEVSDYYRYRPGDGNLWRHQAASGYALVKRGVIIGYEITDGGAGYTTAPTATVLELKNATGQVALSFGKNLATNGAISTLAISQPNAKKPAR